VLAISCHGSGAALDRGLAFARDFSHLRAIEPILWSLN